MPFPAEDKERVVVLAPTGRDSRLIVDTLLKNGIDAGLVQNIDALSLEIRRGVGAAVLTEEALHSPGMSILTAALADQPPWSDLPLIVLTTGGEERSTATWQIVHRLEPGGNVSLLERPLRAITLVSAVQAALRSRRRQYEVYSLYENLERRVAERTAELQRLHEEADGFNYSISHDLRAPLRAIAGTSSMLLSDCGDRLGEDVEILLRRQADAANRMALLIDNLLNLSRLSRQEMSIRSVDLTGMARDVAQELQVQGLAGGCRFEIEEGLTARGDPTLLRFVLINLMHNACKFSPQGGSVQIGRDGQGSFFVRDHGIGFDMQYVDKIFLPFERLVRDDQFPGTGIGLANVRRIVRRHGGKVWAEAEPGNGATFFFLL